jgi:ankyrin repeat protein
VKESEIFNSWNRINVISAEARMGKSVMLKFMKNRYPSCSWVLDVSLRSHFSFFEETQDPQEICRRIFQHHCSANRYNRFEERVGKQFLNKKQVAILLDGLDEIVDFKVICKVIAAVRALSECWCVVWISARRNLETVLINELCLFPLIIKQIDREQQISYAMERLKYGSDETKIIVEKLINLLNTTKSSAILGVLLQMKILTDLLYYNSKKYSQFIDNNFTLTDMIYYFIKETINFHFEDKGDTVSGNSIVKSIFKDYRKNKIEKYEIFSLKYFLDVEDFESLPQAKFLNKSDPFEDDLGIITYVKNTRFLYFSHNIFGEYFAASWFVKNLKYIPNLAKFFFKQRYTNIRRMFDIMLSKNYPAHLAVLHNNLDDLSKYEKELEVRDDHGRNPLHLACSYGQAHPPLLVTQSEDKYIIDFETGHFVQKESFIFTNIFNFLIERCDPSEKDRLFNWDCLHYAINAQSLFCVNSILERFSASHELFENIYDDATLVFYSIKFNYIKLFEFIENLPYFESNDESNLLHQICLWKNRSKFLVTVLRNRQYLSVINKKRCVKQPFYIGNTTLPSCGLELEIFSVRNKVIHCLVVNETPLHIASVLGNFDAVKILIENGADVNVLNNNGFNPLHHAASSGRLDIARLLVKSGAALNVSDVTNRNELHFAVLGIINRELITFLLDEGSFISFDSKKLSPLVIALSRNRLDIVQLLTRIKNFESWTSFKDCMYRGYFFACTCNNPQQINYFLYIGVPIIIEDSYQSSILHCLPLFNAVESFKLLLQKGANVNRKNYGGCSPLHVAAFSGNLNILKLLLDSGADINAQNNLGGTPLYCATFYKRFAAADFLKQNGADSTIADKYGITPDVILELYKYEHDLITRSITLENAKGLYSVIA